MVGVPAKTVAALVFTVATQYQTTIPANPERKHTRGVRTKNPVRLAHVSVEEAVAWEEAAVEGQMTFSAKREGVMRDRARTKAAAMKRFQLRGFKGGRKAPRDKNAADDGEATHKHEFHQVPERISDPSAYAIKEARRERMRTGTEVHSSYRKFASGLKHKPTQGWEVRQPKVSPKPAKPSDFKRVRMISKMINRWKATHLLPPVSMREVENWAPEELNSMGRKRLMAVTDLMGKNGVSRQLIEALLVRGGVELNPGPVKSSVAEGKDTDVEFKPVVGKCALEGQVVPCQWETLSCGKKHVPCCPVCHICIGPMFHGSYKKLKETAGKEFRHLYSDVEDFILDDSDTREAVRDIKATLANACREAPPPLCEPSTSNPSGPGYDAPDPPAAPPAPAAPPPPPSRARRLCDDTRRGSRLHGVEALLFPVHCTPD